MDLVSGIYSHQHSAQFDGSPKTDIPLGDVRGPAGNKVAVIVTAMLLVILTVIIEPIIYHQESLQIQMIQAQADDAAAMIALIAAKQGVREWIRLILYVSGALSFLSMGGFWGKCAKEEEP